MSTAAPENILSKSFNYFDWTDIIIQAQSRRDAQLGFGAFATVYSAQLVFARNDIVNVFEVAVKVFDEDDKKGLTYEKLCQMADQEAAIMTEIGSQILNVDTIAKLYGVVRGHLSHELSSLFGLPDGQEKVGLVMRLERGGDLDSALVKNKHWDLKLRLGLIKNIADGIRELHSAGVHHGDLKPQNILKCDNESDKVVLSDFGLSERRMKISGATTTIRETKSTKGTLVYCSPEMLAHSSNNFKICAPSRKTDMYAFAVVTWEILTGQIPFENFGRNEPLFINNVHSNDISINRPSLDKLPAGVPPEIVEMIKACWDKDRDKRKTASECFAVVVQAFNVVCSKTFDIFLSHAWVNKGVVIPIHAWLTSLGYRVWIDIMQMGHNLEESMKEGITNSTIFLACVNSTYQGSRNCMFELQYAKSIPQKKIVVILLESSISGNWKSIEQNIWNCCSTNKICKDIQDVLKSMYCEISSVAQNDIWIRKEDDFKSADEISLLKRTKKDLLIAVEPLAKILDDVDCSKSFPIVQSSASSQASTQSSLSSFPSSTISSSRMPSTPISPSSEFVCSICKDSTALKASINCPNPIPNPDHKICLECFRGDVRNQLEEGKFASRLRKIVCSQCYYEVKKLMPYDDLFVAASIVNDNDLFTFYQNARDEASYIEHTSKTDAEKQVLIKKSENELLRVKMETEKDPVKKIEAAVALHTHRINNEVIPTTCPHCQLAITEWSSNFFAVEHAVDYDDSGKIRTSGCRKPFCGWCLSPFENLESTHKHVPLCLKSLRPGAMNGMEGDFQMVEAAMRKEKIEKYISDLRSPVEVGKIIVKLDEEKKTIHGSIAMTEEEIDKIVEDTLKFNEEVVDALIRNIQKDLNDIGVYL